jgi:hypothetical protein
MTGDDYDTTVEPSDQTTNQYGKVGCDEAIEVTVDGETAHVPWTGVRRVAYDYRGKVPHKFDVDRIRLVDGRIHAEADVDGGLVEVIPEYGHPTFRSYDRWELEFFSDPIDVAHPVVHRRGDE